MILESPVLPLLNLETFDSGVWSPWLADANSLQMVRGGKRNGPTQTTDVGTLSCTLINTADPLAGGALAPGQPIRVMATNGQSPTLDFPAVPLYSNGFETSIDSWVAANGTTTVSRFTGESRSGSWSYDMSGEDFDGFAITQAKRTVSGFTPGLSYTASAWVLEMRDRTSTEYARVGVTGKSYQVSDALPAYSLNTWTKVSYTFTATATSHEVYLQQTGIYNVPHLAWDDIEVVQDAYSMPNPSYLAPTPIFTGRIVDIDTRYQVDKSTGRKDTFVTISAADSVRDHANTTRYGAVTAGGVGYETWAQRIIRLSSSATTPVETPADDAPIQKYGI